MPHAKLCRWYLDVPGTSRYAFNAKFPSELLAPWYRTFNPPRDKWNIQVVTMAQGSPNDVSRFNVHRQKKTCPLILGSHCQKERVFKPRFFSLEHVTFRSFRGDNNFSNPTRILNRYIIYASIQMDTNPYDTHPWITFQTAFWDPSNPGTLKTPHVLFLLNILCWFLKHEALGSNFCWVSRNVVQNFNPKQPLKSWLLIHTDWNDSETTNEISSQCHCGNCALHTTFGGVCVRNWYAFFCQTFIPRHHLDA